jgi:hypothetical protein
LAGDTRILSRMASDIEAEKDLRRAREMVRNSGSIVGNMGSMRENIAALVARALAEGRAEGIKIGERRARGEPDV